MINAFLVRNRAISPSTYFAPAVTWDQTRDCGIPSSANVSTRSAIESVVGDLDSVWWL